MSEKVLQVVPELFLLPPVMTVGSVGSVVSMVSVGPAVSMVTTVGCVVSIVTSVETTEVLLGEGIALGVMVACELEV